MGGPCNFEDITAQRVCAYVEDIYANSPVEIPFPVDDGITRTDFSDPQKPVRRYIEPDGEFTDVRSDGVKTAEEYYQAAIRLAEMVTKDFKGGHILPKFPDSVWGPRLANLPYFLKNVGVRIFWLPTDPLLFPEDGDEYALEVMNLMLEGAERIWRDTESIEDIKGRRWAFAYGLYQAMIKPQSEGGFGLYNPQPGPWHHSRLSLMNLYSYRLSCMGAWMYAFLCERYGLKGSIIQEITDENGVMLEHVLAGFSYDPDNPDELTFVSFDPGELGFNITFEGKSTWAPISRLENLAEVHLHRAAVHYIRSQEQEQWEELQKAYRYAPHSYHVHTGIGIWYLNNNMFDEARRYFNKALELYPGKTQVLKLIEALDEKESRSR